MAVLVDDQGSPLFLPNVYATLHYRDVGSSSATINKALRALGMAYLWASARKLDLHAAISSEAFLSIEQCEDHRLSHGREDPWPNFARRIMGTQKGVC